MPSQSVVYHPSVVILEYQGVRSLCFERDGDGVMALQGAMRMAMPDQIELEYVQQMMMWMLFNDAPKHIVQLGLGSAALTKFCYRRFPAAQISAVELNPKVIAACHEHFKLPPNDARLNVMAMNALEFVLNPANHASRDILQVDLYDAQALEPALGSVEFYQSCANCLSENGMITVNLFCDGDTENSAYADNLQAIQAAFDAVVWLPEVHDANVVALAFKRAPAIDFSVLYERAVDIRSNMKLPAPVWVNGLKEWMGAEE
ncbi:spermidine synthase [Solimicrobium silvestre]|uniref:Spermine/spermidine synthase n=1 Tax=Solimicrobium silvestre TaxID=2099400 RepID=A0A2S9GYI4_9BURK|nr:spermidine synthase [Solimicrobium silvestre]PRC92760.1 Spermine/spermidine synthase [Solimicrobium silvestre]